MSGGLSNLCSRSRRNLARMFRTCQAFVVRYHAQTMYNIKQAAAMAGVSVPVLRAWERRYGIVSPPRTASGYRQFDNAAVARVRTMRELVGEGWSPSAAAAAILSGEVRSGDAAGRGRDRSGRGDRTGRSVRRRSPRALTRAPRWRNDSSWRRDSSTRSRSSSCSTTCSREARSSESPRTCSSHRFADSAMRGRAAR